MIRISSLLLLFALACSGCSSEGSPVHLVVPNGFTGELRLILDPTRGTEIPRTNGRYTYNFPSDGTLYVKSFAPFVNWHKQTSAYADGTPIPDAIETVPGPNGMPATVGKDVVVLNGGSFGTRNDGPETGRYYVGTVAEYEKYLERR